MSLTTIIGEALTGAWTGYITNTLAIKMLFKEYNFVLFKCGGIVVKTRKEFTENASSLVENNIINHKTLHDELLKDEFTQSLEGFVKDFLQNSLYQNTNNLNYGAIPAYEKSTQNIMNYLNNNLAEKLSPLLDIIIQNIAMEDLISNKQINYLSNNLYESVLKIIDTDDFVEKSITEFYSERSKDNFGDFFGRRILQVLLNNLKENTTDFHSKIEANFDLDIDAFLQTISKELNFKQVIEKLERELNNKELIDFFGSEKGRELSRTLLLDIKKFINSADGKNLIRQFCINIFSVLRNINSPLLDLLSSDLKDNLEYFLINKLPDIIQEIIRWIQVNKREIENLIEEAIDETIAREGDIKRKVLKVIRTLFMQNITQKYDLIAKIIKYLETNTDIVALSKKLSKEIANYLKETNVSTIIKTLEQKRILTPDKLNRLIQMNIQNYIDDIPQDVFDKLLYTKLGDIANINLSKYLEKELLKKSKTEIASKFLYTDKFTNLFHRQLSEKTMLLADKSLNDIFPEDKLAENIPKIKKYLVNKTRENQKEIVGKLSENIKDYLEGKRLVEFLETSSQEKILQNIEERISFLIQDKVAEYKYTPISNSLDKLNTIPHIEEKTTTLVNALMQDNLEILLKNNIKTAVSNNLTKLKDEEIQQMIEDFMGKELKPITILGALLGGIVGLGLGLTPFNLSKDLLGLPANFDFWGNLLGNSLIFAFLGYITNVIAIKMLFKPYKSHKILGFNFQGVISKQKPRFAKAMGEFVDKELLSRNTISTLVSDKKDLILANLKTKCSQDNYHLLEEIILKYSDKICVKLYELSCQYSLENRQDIVNKFLAELKYLDLYDLDLANLERKLDKNILDKIKYSKDELAKEIFQFLQSNKPLQTILPEFAKSGLDEIINKEMTTKVNQLLNFIEDENNINKLLDGYSSKFEKLREKSLDDLVSTKQKLNIKKALNVYIQDKLTSSEGKEKIFELIEENFLKEIDPNKKIGELFNGSLIKVLNNNGNYIINSTIMEIENYLKNNQVDIAQTTIDSVWGNLKIKGKIGYKTIKGDKLIRNIVENLANEKLPKFLDSKRYELEKIFQRFSNLVIARSQVADLGIDLEPKSVQNIVDRFLGNQEVGKQIEIMSAEVLDYLMKIELNKYLRILGIRKVFDLTQIFASEITLIREDLANNIYTKQEAIIATGNKLVSRIVYNLILDKPLYAVTAGITQGDIASTTQKITLSVYSSDAIRKNIQEFITTLTEEKIKTQSFNDLFDFKELGKSLDKTIKNLPNNEEMGEQIIIAIQKALTDFAPQLNKLCANESKDFLIEMLMKSILKSAEYNIDNILQSIDFQKVAETEINTMETKEIEDLFKSFAGKYFTQLELYGFWGGAFGLHYGVSIVAFFLYLKSSWNDKAKKDKVLPN